MMYGHHMDAASWVFSVGVTLLVLALIAAAIVWLLGNQSAGTAARPDREGDGGSARDVLDRRLASGAINEEEYSSLRAALTETPAPPQPAHTAD